MIKAVFLDIDNTLTSRITRRIPESAKQAIARARENGIKVFVCTGRNTRTPEEYGIIDGIVLDGYVAVNGQMCYLPDGAMVHCLPLDAEDVATVQRYCRERGIALLVSERDRNYITHIDDAVRTFHETIKIPLYAEQAVDDLSGREILALSPFAPNDCEAHFRAMLKHSETVRFNDMNFDVIPKGGGKNVGMERMLAHFGLTLQDAMAIGDGENDIAMLRAAGIGVAMGGSDVQVIAAADETAPTPDEDGIYVTFQRHGLL